MLVVGSALLSALTGCSPSAQGRAEQPSPSSTVVVARSKTPSSGSTIGVPPSVPHDIEPAPSVAPEGAREVAVEAMKRFCRPRLSKARWIAELDPLLTLEAASVYATVDPIRVSCTDVVAPARLIEGDGFTQLVAATTNGPTYRVTLSRSSLSDPWLVFRITPVAAR